MSGDPVYTCLSVSLFPGQEHMSKFLLLIATAALFASSASAQSKRPMTFEDMMNMKRLGSTAVSKDGKWLAYSVTTVNLDQNAKTTELWVQKIEGGEPIKLAVGQPGDDGAKFAPDGRSVLFLSGREHGQQVWIADFDEQTGAAGNPRRLTNIATGADNAIWSPDGQSIVFTSAVYPDCPAITTADFDSGDKCNAGRDAAAAASKVKAQIFTSLMFRHWNRYTGDKRSHLFLVNVASGAMRDLNPGDTHDIPPFSLEDSGCECNFSPDSKELAFTEKKVSDEATSTSASIFTLDLTDSNARPVKVSTSAGGNFDPAYSPDGKYLAWRSQARAGYESDKFRLVLYDREKKTIRDLLPNFENWVDEFVWDAGSRQIAFTSGAQGEENVYLIALGSGKSAVQLTRSGTFSNLHLLARSYGPQAAEKDRMGAIVATRETAERPDEAVLIHPGDALESVAGQPGVYAFADSPVRGITRLNDPLLDQLNLPKLEKFWFTAKDGTKLQGFIIPPPAYDPQKKYPVKFLIHGGPQGAWSDSWSYRWNAQLFAANGYAVVMINPRGSTGYGQAIIDGVNGDWGGKPFTDLMTGLDYAEQHYPFIDKTRECALGASYGGYMANWILGHTSRFRCIVSHDGMFDPDSAYGSTDELWFMEWEFRGKPWDYYNKPAGEDPYRKWSPALAAINFKTPTLVIHSQLDYRLDVSQGFQLFTTLQRLGVPSKMLYFPDEGHWVLKPQNSELWYKTVNGWVDQWTAISDQ
jgi:dipeptidyl aminopeptidase/acylaminoacyl peptidase